MSFCCGTCSICSPQIITFAATALKRQYTGLFSIYAIGTRAIHPSAVGPYLAIADMFTRPLEAGG
jgi:hypothetical protein